jgi:outer membrane protein assembly factor BamB
MLVVLLVVGGHLSASHLLGADWPHWRGPSRDGHTDEPSGFTDGKWLADRPVWTAQVGAGASSPIVVGDRVIVFGHTDGYDVVHCLDAKTGKEAWVTKNKGPEYGRFHMGDEGLYSGPSSTAEYDPDTQLLFTLGLDGDLRCWNMAADGKEAWTLNVYDVYQAKRRPKLTRAPQRDYGYTSSPLVHGPWLLVEVGSPTGTLIALDKTNGKEAWRSELTDEAGHTGGPVPMTVEGVPCVAVLTQRHLAVIRLDAGHEGKTVATYDWVTDFANNVASPAVLDNYVVVTSQYNQNAICKLKVSLKGAEKVWSRPYPSKVCTPVIHDGHVYVAWQKVRCLDWESGKLVWEGGNVGDPGSCVVTGDERLLVYGGTGRLALIETAKRSPKAFTELAAKDGFFKAEAWPHVAVAGRRVFCRDRDGSLACFQIGR